MDQFAARAVAWQTDSDPDAVDDATLTEMGTALCQFTCPNSPGQAISSANGHTDDPSGSCRCSGCWPATRPDCPRGGSEPMSRRLRPSLSRLAGRIQTAPLACRDDPENGVAAGPHSCVACEIPPADGMTDARPNCGESLIRPPTGRESAVQRVGSDGTTE